MAVFQERIDIAFIFEEMLYRDKKHIDQCLKILRHSYSYYWKSGIAVHLACVIKRYQI